MMIETVKKTVRVNDVDLYVETYGAGEPLVLLHGFTGSSVDWVHAGRDRFAEHFRLIAIDARGHGRSPNPPGSLTHRQCALDTVAVLDRLGIERCKAIGLSFGGNILLHLAMQHLERVEAMVLVSSTPYFPEQARKLMASLAPEPQSAEVWDDMRKRHVLGDEQILALFEQQHAFKDSYDDMNLTPPALARIRSRTLLVQGDRDPLYPLELSVEMYRAIPNAELAVVPNAGHGPIFGEYGESFVQRALEFLKRS